MAEDKPQGTFEKALQSWTEANLPQLQKNLDTPALSIKSNQESSLVSRRELATRTKDFKKLDDSSKLKEIKTLLKQYQNEIDRLTERAKTSEGAFFEVYRVISEVPDPKPLLEASLDSVITATEVEELREKDKRLENELVKVADYDQLKSRLLRSEQKFAETLNLKLKLKENEMQSVIDEKSNEWKSKEEKYLKDIEEFQKEVNELKTQQKVDTLRLKNQRIALGEEEEADDQKGLESLIQVSTNAANLELLKRENQNIELRNLQLQKRNEELVRELTVAKSDLTKQDQKAQNELKLSELENDNILLVAKLEHEKKLSDDANKTNSRLISNLNREVNQLKKDVENDREKLAKYKDYEDIKHELITLRTISFGNDDDSDDDINDTEEEDPVKSSSTQLDEMLVLRNQKLTKEVTEFRSKHAALSEKVEALTKNLQENEKIIARLTESNNKLESDLSSVQGSTFDTMSMLSGVTKMSSVRAPSARHIGGRISPASSIAGGSIMEETESSVLPIVTSQRDRFRSRNIELETQIKKQANIISELKQEISKLKKHNTELFEKTRYLWSHSQGSVNRRSLNYNSGGEAYESNYEESLHPLTQFRQREAERITSKLSPLERIFLSFAKAILANKTSRMLFLGYCVGLHFLVMAMSFYVMSLHGALTPEVGIVNKTQAKIQ